jgi:hypothetical protein
MALCIQLAVNLPASISTLAGLEGRFDQNI